MSKLIKIKRIIIIFIIFLLFFNVINISTPADDDPQPDLTIVNFDCPDEVKEGETINIGVKIKNIGKKNISAYPNDPPIEVGLYIDYGLVAVNSRYNGLNIGNSVFMNFSWTATASTKTKRLLRAIVDYQDKIFESNENNNVIEKYISVIEKEPELKITEFYLSKSPRVNETVNVYANVSNYGKDTNKVIYAKLIPDIGDEIEAKPKKGGLSKGNWHLFEFKWIPSDFGSQKIKAIIYFTEGNIEDSFQKTVFVDVGELEWWNSSWHYRHFVGIKGSGNVSLSVNFTEFLEYLDLYSHEFENDTIRIIEYYTNGTIVEDGEVKIFKFNESVGFDKYTNSKGTLLWNITESSKEKYYCIYFDVKDNSGIRTALSETDNIVASGDAILNYSGLIGGWLINVVKPVEGGYCLFNELINITVDTTAKAENVSAYIFWDENESYNFTIYLTHKGEKISWSYDNFNFIREGNWTIRVNSIDGAGYQPAIVENDFYVGIPDLKIVNISFKTDWPSTSPTVYKNNIVTITSYFFSYNATVDDVTVTMSIFDVNNNISVYNTSKTNLIISKDEDNIVSFDWLADKVGKYKVTMTVDPEDTIDELNESNNQMTKNMVVYGWPDLGVENVYLPVKTVMAGETARVDAEISNHGEGDATGYTIGLYVEHVKEGYMSYSKLVDTTLISVQMNSTERISLTWENVEPGEWFVGVKVIINSTKKDINLVNNQNISETTLKVRSQETNPPIIINITVIPDTHEQGGEVTITAIVTDDSGIESVTIKILSPNNISYSKSMIRQEGDIFSVVFDDTFEVGKYNFEIEAVDISIYANKATSIGSFTITEDSTSPIITYFDAKPYVQIIGDNVEITCIATDNIMIDIVEVTVIYSDVSDVDYSMTWSTAGKYVYNKAYDTLGKHRFYITVFDRAGNKAVTGEKVFWITLDKNDTDNDGMPDWWEKKYGLNPEDPNDADIDKDGDGYSNLKEYQIDTDPAKDIFIQNALYRVKENILYLVGSVLLFLFLLFLSIFGRRRKLK